MSDFHPKRICLFAGYDATNKIQDYVLYYLRKLSKEADIYYLADCAMPAEELEKLSGITKKAIAFRHQKYDFGSWQELVKLIGWHEIEQYDELIFANDSCYGPFFPFSEVFERMQSQKVDFWGMTQSNHIRYHLQSYFLVFNNKIIKNNKFRDFVSAIEHKDIFMDIVKSYEIGLTKLLEEEGFIAKAAFVKPGFQKNLCVYPNQLLKYRCPLIKVKCFIPIYNHLNDWYPSLKKTLNVQSQYNCEYIWQHLLSKRMNLKINDVLLCFQHPLLKWVYKAKIKNGEKKVRLFLIPIYKKKL